MIDKKDLVVIRNVKPGDHNFIMATWLRGAYYGDTWFREIPKDIFMSAYSEVIKKVLSNPSVLVQVACLKEDSDVILGYSVLAPNTTGITLHWCFVKSAWRGIGVAKSLVPGDKTSAATHLTKAGLSIIKKHPHVIFNPFLIG